MKPKVYQIQAQAYPEMLKFLFLSVTSTCSTTAIRKYAVSSYTATHEFQFTNVIGDWLADSGCIVTKSQRIVE